MKKFIPFLLISAVILHYCSGKETFTPVIRFDQSACIKLIAENVIDSIGFEAIFDSYFTKIPISKNIILRKKGTSYIEIPMILPELAEIIFNNKDSLKTYLIPGDTLNIKLNQLTTGNGHLYTEISIDDKIFDYCQSKYKKFGYHKILDGPARKKWLLKPCSSQKEYERLIRDAEAVEAENISFLLEYSNSLPLWFIKLETNNIHYITAQCKLVFFQSLNNYSKKSTNTFNVPLFNPDARLSFEYYRFLDSYFRHGHMPDTDIDGTSRVLSILNNEYQNIDSTLKGQIKSTYFTWIIADLFNFCTSDAAANKVDTFMNSHDLNITSEGLKYINQQKELAYLKRVDLASLKTGDNAPGFELQDTKGNISKLSDFKGKVVYLHFWATWCGPCIGEIPDLNQLIKSTVNQNIVFINICLDNDYNKWLTIITENNLLGLNLICNDKWNKKLSALYKTSAIPHYVLIDKQGLIIKNNCARPGIIRQEYSQYFPEK